MGRAEAVYRLIGFFDPIQAFRPFLAEKSDALLLRSFWLDAEKAHRDELDWAAFSHWNASNKV